jgi:hypothetical protein
MIAEFQRIMNETKQVIEKEKENTQVEDAKSKLIERQNAINFIKELKLNYTSFKPGQERREYENGGESSNYFSDGGDVNPPIFTSNRNDPRLQSYNDSLNLYNNSEKRIAELKRFGDINNLKYVTPSPGNYVPYEHPDIAPIDRTGFVYNFDINNPNGQVKMVKKDGSLSNDKNLYNEASSLQRRLSGSISQIVPIYKKPVQQIVYKPKPDPKIVTQQQELIKAGYDIGKPDGVWGSKSKQAWEDYQAKKNTPTTTPIETTPAPKVERKVVSITPEEVKAGTKTTSGKQIGSGTAGGRIYKVSYDNGETEILNEYEYRSRGLKMENGGEIKKYKFKTKQK